MKYLGLHRIIIIKLMRFINNKQISFLTFGAGLAQARASMDPSEAWPGIDLSRIGQFGKEKFQISIDMSPRDRAKRFLIK